MLNNKGRHVGATKQSLVTPKTIKLGSNLVQELKINQRRIFIDSLEIGIPAPEQMITLGERQLPNGVKVGQLLNSKTLNYKKFTPHRDGLFCERIFGPVQSFVCACGKKKESVLASKSREKDLVKTRLSSSSTSADMSDVTPFLQTEALFCPKCQVEYISKNVRRHRLGYIKLFAPVTHIWYLKGRPSYLSLFLGKRKKAITSLAYCNAYLVEQVYSDFSRSKLLKDTDRSVSTKVGKGNRKNWQTSFFMDQGEINENSQPTRKTRDSSSLLTAEFDRSTVHKERPLERLTKPKECAIMFGKDAKQDFASRAPKRKKGFENRLRLTSQGREHFFSRLAQLFPEIFLQEWLAKLCFASQSPISNQTLIRRNRSEKNKNLLNQDIQRENLVGNSLRYKVSTNLQAVNSLVETVSQGSFGKGTTKPQKNKTLLHEQSLNYCLDSVVPREEPNPVRTFTYTDDNALLGAYKNTSKASFVTRVPYTRAQTLPFLPSLICPFHLRDCLVSFLQSLPSAEDLPVPFYCQTPRRYPLRDVHKFIAESRSTNSTNQEEKLSNESILKFKGLSLEIRPFLTPFREKEHRDIVVHKPRSKNLFDKKQIDASRSVKRESGEFGGMPNEVWIAKRSFVRTQALLTKPKVLLKLSSWRVGVKTPVGEDVTLSTNCSVGINQRYQQGKKKSFTLRRQPKKPLSIQGLNGKRPRKHAFKKHAFLPLALRFVMNFNLVRNRSTTLSSKSSLSKNFLLNAEHLTTEPCTLALLERDRADRSTHVQTLTREKGMSLRGLLLYVFLDMILTGLTDLSRPESMSLLLALAKPKLLHTKVCAYKTEFC